MAMIENGGADLGSSSHNFSEVIQGTKNFERNISDSNDSDQQIQEHLSRNQQKNQSGFHKMEPNLQKNAILQKKNAILHQNQQIFQPNQFHNVEHLMKVQQLQQRTVSVGTHKLKQEQQELKNGLQPQQSLQQQQQHGMMGKSAIVGGHQHPQQRLNGIDLHGNGEEGFKRDMRELVDLLSKLNPMAEEFVPPSLVNHGSGAPYSNNFLMQNNISGNGNNRRKKNNYSQGKRRMNSRTSMAQREEIIRRTVYVSDIDQQVTEEQLAALFINCGQVVDCRVCGDPNSVLRFAFIEFTDEEGARAALSLAGTMLGYYPVRVLPSKTAIAPVNPTFLPRSEDEREMCARTIYCTNIDKTVSQAELKLFFERICGAVFRLRLLGDYHHSTRIAFVEFVEAESAIAALHCSGARLGSLPIRVSPSKTPVRPRAPRPPMH